MADDIRVNPYSQLAERVQQVHERRREKHKREHEQKPEEPQDVVELGHDEEEAATTIETDMEDGLDIAV